MGYPANQRAAHVPASAAAHEQEESCPGDRAGVVVLLSRHRRWYIFSIRVFLNQIRRFSFLILILNSLPVESIVITPFLPVVAFGRPLPKLSQQ